MTDQSSCVCIVCRKAMKNYLHEGLQPDAGLSFMTKGHYGSTFFDPMDGSYLEICVCDECLTKAAADGLVYRGEMFQLAKYKVEPGGAVRWCAPDATGELRIEDFIRKIRDEGWAMATRSYSDLSDSATTFDPEEQFDRDIDERMKGMSKEDAVAKAIQDAYQDFANKTAYEHMQMGDLILKHVASAAIAAADKWDAEQGKGSSTAVKEYSEWSEVGYERARDCMMDILSNSGWLTSDIERKTFDDAFQHAVGILSLTPRRSQPVESSKFECMARRNATPDPVDCNWPDCGCDDHATKVIESLVEQGWTDGRSQPAQSNISPGLDSAIQDELDHPPASIMEEGK